MINLKNRLTCLAVSLTMSLLTISSAQAADGAALAKTNQCTACHAIDKKLVGPAFSEVATKYRSNTAAVDTLVGSIKSGSKGKWGVMAMPSNSRLSDADLHSLADWVLAQ
jgi:cytochrome c551/c552